MEFRILVETRLDDRILERELVSRVERPACGIGPEEIGLTLEEGKAVLRKVQAQIVQTQVDVLGGAHKGCLGCGRNQRVKDLRTRKVRTVFGTVQVSCRRYHRCNCQVTLPLECVCIMRGRPFFRRKVWWPAQPAGALPPRPQDLTLWCLSR